MRLVPGGSYRQDIDGLRAIAVLAVIVFHFGHLPTGFLGVDVFFVISGYLITGIIAREAREGRFSIVEFYMRRTRRIAPLALFVSGVALAVGTAVMLPDDLENLAQSVIATNFFANNVLQAVTTKNYWDVVNEFKPLMHTWSLGVEEQFYLLFPLVFLVARGKRFRFALPALAGLAGISFALYLLPGFEGHQKFYLIFFRIWELALGGIGALLLKDRQVEYKFPAVPLLLLVFLLGVDVPAPRALVLTAVVLLSLVVLASANGKDPLVARVLQNRAMVFLGKISFSLYMWHQVLLAFARYAWVQHLGPKELAGVGALTFALSLLTYYFVEQPFRDRRRVRAPYLLAAVGAAFALTTAFSFYAYSRGGVVRDIPELGIRAGENVGRGVNARYNHRIYELDLDFNADSAAAGKQRVLVVGNSFARDWANVVLESRFGPGLQVSYVYEPAEHAGFAARARAADVIFYSEADPGAVRRLALDTAKLWVPGVKNFGSSSGIFYNYRGDKYFEQRVAPAPEYRKANAILAAAWGGRYLDYLAKVSDADSTVPVFTPDSLFISQDCRHLTRAGARYFSRLFDAELSEILGKASVR